MIDERVLSVCEMTILTLVKSIIVLDNLTSDHRESAHLSAIFSSMTPL